MSHCVSKKFTATLPYLLAMLDFVRQQSINMPFSIHQRSQIELAAEEILVNIISYSYSASEGVVEIQCSLLDANPGLQIVFIDSGVPFNPLVQNTNIKLLNPLDNQHVGGYGIHVVLEIMDEISYRYRDGHNILMLSKFCR